MGSENETNREEVEGEGGGAGICSCSHFLLESYSPNQYF